MEWIKKFLSQAKIWLRKDGSKNKSQNCDNITTYKFLLLGMTGSGRTTIFNQIKYLYANGFSNEERKQKFEDIKEHICRAIIQIIRAMRTLTPPIKLEKNENEAIVEYIKNVASLPSLNYPQEFFENIEELWKDGGIQEAFERSNEYDLIDNAKYFLDRVNKFKNPNYIPSYEECLRCRTTPKAIFILEFQIDKNNFHVIAARGPRCGSRPLWRYAFEDLTGIIFTTDCSNCDMVLYEDETTNCLKESLTLFESILNNKWFITTPVILFLNKLDLLAEKVIAGKCKLSDHFPEFEKYKIPNDAIIEPGENLEVVRTKYFIRDQFLSISNDTYNDQRHPHPCYPHFTCAVDSESIKNVLKCQEILRRLRH